MSDLDQKYKFIKTLGSQTKRKFGEVYLVKNKITGDLSVLKTIIKTPTNIHLQERIRKESTFSFDKPGLPRTIELIENESQLILIKSYCPGLPLDEYWSKLNSSERLNTLKLIIKQLIPIFDELKKQRIVHCDLKPSNILVNQTEQGFEIALIDFGMALRTDEVNERSTLFPLGYAAPEILLNKLDLVDQRTDLYSLGIIIWRLFTGKLPLTHPNPSIFTNLQLTYPLPDSPELPKGIYPILQKMCVKHSFRNAPNLLPSDEVTRDLKNALNERYSDLHEVQSALELIKVKKNWFGF
jgi:serine/threonine protein kinase